MGVLNYLVESIIYLWINKLPKVWTYPSEMYTYSMHSLIDILLLFGWSAPHPKIWESDCKSTNLLARGYSAIQQELSEVERAYLWNGSDFL